MDDTDFCERAVADYGQQCSCSGWTTQRGTTHSWGTDAKIFSLFSFVLV